MRRLILIILAIALLAVPAMAAEEYIVTFSWQQPSSGLPYLSHWNLYMTGDGTEKQVTAIPYVEGQISPFEAPLALTIDALPGESVTRYFHLCSVTKDAQESAPSVEASHTFTIPYPAPESPTSLTIEAVVRVKVQGE